MKDYSRRISERIPFGSKCRLAPVRYVPVINKEKPRLLDTLSAHGKLITVFNFWKFLPLPAGRNPI